MLPEPVIKAHRLAAFLAAVSPENTPFFADFCEMFSQCAFYKEMTPAQTMEAQADLKQRMAFMNDVKVSNDFVLAQILQEILLNLTTINARVAKAMAERTDAGNE